MSDKTGEISRRTFLRTLGLVATSFGLGASAKKLASGEPTEDEKNIRRNHAINEYNRIVELDKYQEDLEKEENKYNYRWVEMGSPDKVFIQELYLTDASNLHMPIYLMVSDPITRESGEKTVGVISHVVDVSILKFGPSYNKAVSETKRSESPEIFPGISYYPPDELKHLDLVELKNSKADITKMKLELESIIGVDKKAT